MSFSSQLITFLITFTLIGVCSSQTFLNSTTPAEQALDSDKVNIPTTGLSDEQISTTATTSPPPSSNNSTSPVDTEDEAARILVEHLTATTHQNEESTTASSTQTSTTKDDDALLLELLRVPPNRSTVRRRGRPNPFNWRPPNAYFEYKTDWNNSIQVLVTKESWESYTRFKEETCRETNDTYIANRVLHDIEHPYFKWEENVFHQELRKIILPETRDGSYSSLIGTPMLKNLDPRFFKSKPESMCKSKKRDTADSDAARIKAEQDLFEDYLINKVFPEPLLQNNMTSEGQLVPPLFSLVIPLMTNMHPDYDTSSFIDMINALDKDHINSRG